MRRYSLFLALAVVLIVSLFTLPAFSQEEKTPAVKAPAASAPAPTASAPAPTAPAPAPAVAETAPAKAPEMPPAPAPAAAPMKELSIYGEVKTVNSPAGSMTVQYYDYDSDEEKSIDVIADKDTKFENVANVGEIKQGDWIDATYAAKDNQNIAKSIIVEKEEMPPETENAPTGTAATGTAEE